MRRFAYGKLALKESLRLNPISIGVGRISPVDAIFSDYLVPAGTVLVSQNQVTCRLQKYFPEPDRFLPERWERKADKGGRIHPYLSLPFGFGPRMCIGRRLAEQGMLVLTNGLFARWPQSVKFVSCVRTNCISLYIGSSLTGPAVRLKNWIAFQSSLTSRRNRYYLKLNVYELKISKECSLPKKTFYHWELWLYV